MIVHLAGDAFVFDLPPKPDAHCFRFDAVILPCRDPIRGEKAAEEIRAAQRSSGHEVDVKVVEMDLSDLSSVEACVKNVTELDCPLHLLINNGGIYDLGGEIF